MIYSRRAGDACRHPPIERGSRSALAGGPLRRRARDDPAGEAALITLVGGGARSGKSAFALAHARRLGARRAFLATAEPLDEEMRARIARHRDERGDAFVTIEEARDLPGALGRLGPCDVVVVDCLTLWLSNLLMAGMAVGTIHEQVDALVAALAARRFRAVLVTNEVGMGIVPETPLGRTFRDLAGQTHQRLAAVAGEIYLATLGVVLRLHPGPVERAR